MATQYVDDCTWRIIEHDVSTDPETGLSTLRARWRGRRDLAVTQYAALIPGGACPVTGFTGLTLQGKPQLVAKVGPFNELIATYTGLSTDFSLEVIAPQSVYLHEERTVILSEKGRQWECTYLAPRVNTVWQSKTKQSEPRYVKRMNEPDPAPIGNGQKLKETTPDDEIDWTVDVHYTVVTVSGWSERGQDPAGFWNNVEFAMKILDPIK